LRDGSDSQTWARKVGRGREPWSAHWNGVFGESAARAIVVCAKEPQDVVHSFGGGGTAGSWTRWGSAKDPVVPSRPVLLALSEQPVGLGCQSMSLAGLKIPDTGKPYLAHHFAKDLSHKRPW